MKTRISLPWASLYLGTALLLLGASLTGHLLAGASFPHDKHAADLTCGDCHAPAADGVRMSFPAGDTCVSCHEDAKGVSLDGLDARPRRMQANFNHKSHEALGCADCHGDPAAGAAITAPDAARCASCHAENDIAVDGCMKCHSAARFLPRYHDRQWTLKHGQQTRLYVKEPHGRTCEDCHSDTSCRACHQQTRPASHNGFWRTRGHGLRAEIDRESCAVCHDEASCVACHRQTRPVNHNGAWKALHGRAGATGASLGNCGLCHTATSCADCHSSIR